MRLPDPTDVSYGEEPEIQIDGIQLSPAIDQIALALSEAMKDAEDPPKTATGYGYKYAPLDEVLPRIRKSFSKHGLALLQHPFTPAFGYVGIVSIVMHGASGQWIKGAYSVKEEGLKGMNTFQSSGAAFTYFRRYAAEAIACLAASPDVDAANQKESKPPAKKSDPKLLKTLAKEAENGMEFLSVAYKSLPEETRALITSSDKAKLKEIANAH